MRIIFLCGCLEPGRDGVGDYVRRLAKELFLQGHEISAISLNDTYISQKVSAMPDDSGNFFPLFRLPSIWSADKRFNQAKQIIEDFDTEWLSLQFVPFSFHSKGLPFKLAKQLTQIGKGRKWHFMMHELWVGMDYESSIKHILWGKFQRFLIKSLIAQVQPRLIHTQTHVYQAQLRNIGFKSLFLPLFSNIPNIAKEINTNSDNAEKTSILNKSIRLVIFGNIHSGAPIETFANDVARYAKDHNISIVLTMIGRCGNEQEQWAAKWRAVGLPLEILGEQGVERISEVLANSSLGITTTPLLLTEKSGTAMAMQEHGLSVLCVSHHWQPKGIAKIDLPTNISQYTKDRFSHHIAEKRSSVYTNNVSSVARELISSLFEY